MDVFSAGAIIAEILMDGVPLFDFARLQSYRKGVYDPEPELRKRIFDSKIVDLILSMINRDASMRLPILTYI